MTEFKLGDKVSVSDFMVRIDAEMTKFHRVIELWPDVPPALVTRYEEWETSGRDKYETSRLWIPASVEAQDWIGSRRDKHHPAPWFSQFKLPDEAYVTRKLVAACGSVSYEEWGREMNTYAYTTMYEAVYHLSRVPLRVLPSMITKIEGDD